MNQKTWIAIAIFGGLTLVAMLSNTEKERGISRISFKGVTVDSIDRVVLSGKNSAELKQKGDRWHLVTAKGERKVSRKVSKSPKKPQKVPKSLKKSQKARKAQKVTFCAFCDFL